MPTVHLLHGFVGAGKTTFGQDLADEIGAVYYDADEWMITLFGSRPPVDHLQEYFERVRELIWRNSAQMLKLNLDVILDFGFWTRQSRDDARRRAAELGAAIKLYRITCSEVEMRRRALARDEDTPEGANWIESAATQTLNQPFEPLEKDETHIEVYSE